MKTITEITATKQEPEYIRLAAYCRVSSNSEDQLHSFAAQIQYYTEYAQKNPQYRLVDIYADEGITGTSMNKRDELNRLLRDCKNGLVDRIIVKSVSRLARNTEELLTMLRLLSEIGVSVYFEENGIDTNMMSSEMLVTFPGMAAQQESLAISGNMRWSYKKRMEAGEFNCCAPAYGFKLVDGKMEIDETDAATVRNIFDLYLQGFGKQSIANILNGCNVQRNYKRKRWHGFTIDYILKNERYIGDALLQKTWTTNEFPFKRKNNNGEQPKYYVENSNPAIISKEKFMAVQALMKRRTTGTSKKKMSYLLTGIIKCPECGRFFRRQRLNGKTYWICSGKASGTYQCKSLRVKVEEVFNAFTIMIMKLSKNIDYILKPLIKQVDELLLCSNSNQYRVQEIDRQIADLSAQNLLIARLHSKGILGVSDYSQQSAEISNKIASLRSNRKKHLSRSKDDELLDELKTFYEMLTEYDVGSGFDANLFEQIISYIIVKNNSELTFILPGGIELTERIRERGRCKSL